MASSRATEPERHQIIGSAPYEVRTSHTTETENTEMKGETPTHTHTHTHTHTQINTQHTGTLLPTPAPAPIRLRTARSPFVPATTSAAVMRCPLAPPNPTPPPTWAAHAITVKQGPCQGDSGGVEERLRSLRRELGGRTQEVHWAAFSALPKLSLCTCSVLPLSDTASARRDTSDTHTKLPEATTQRPTTILYRPEQLPVAELVSPTPRRTLRLQVASASPSYVAKIRDARISADSHTPVYRSC
jgi:hypothetical protein